MDKMDIKHMRALILTNEVNVPDYLIHKTEENTFLIHRELEPNEAHYYQGDKDQILNYKGQKFLFSIASFETLKEAEKAILEYWSVIKIVDIKVRNKSKWLLCMNSNNLKGFLQGELSKRKSS